MSKIFKLLESNGKPIVHFKLHVFQQVIVASILCSLLLTGYFALMQNWFAVGVFVANMLVCVVCYYIAERFEPKFGTSLFLVSATLTSCFFMWRSEGLNDEAILAFPALLIFAMLVSNLTFVRFLLLVICCNILLNGFANQYGFYVNETTPSDIDTAIVLILVLIIVSLSVYLAFVNTQQLLSDLAQENEKVTQSKQEIIRLQNHDALTGLPNRAMAEDVVRERLKLGAREGFETSLLFIDLDNFKTINDTLGHAIGDTVLITVADRLMNCVRETDTVCRFGGDEFVVIALHERDDHSPHYSALAEKILEVVSAPIKLDASNISPTVSIGISVAPGDATGFSELYQKADLAMYSTKRSGRNSYQYFNADMNKDSARHLRLSQDLRAALTNHEFSLLYQSKQMIETGEVVAAEALIRWEHPELGMISPVEFIPIAEQSGFISEIGYWVLREAVKTCKSWHDAGLANLCVAVNVSAIQFQRGNFEDKVQAVLEEYDLDGEFLILELTESVFFDMHSKFNVALCKIISLNVRVAIDDFGTGYSNLGYLHKNDINILKIDRSFIHKIFESDKDLAIVEMIVNMSQTLDMRVVAEGVESEKQRQQLLNIGCTYGQGYLWSKPVSSQAFLALAKSTQKT
ncbi:EAL domain-containing protein [Glaciecola sp. XM2]|uniref:putative bifunctional diguanylate cyclase/phosphodiesterase n=1 Tax=Glaciecola sp. XM2 TaxID=1914931 RepID=UPI001BDF6617|nr:EAL domain-containing protein [Glaciecola sp. XM2]